MLASLEGFATHVVTITSVSCVSPAVCSPSALRAPRLRPGFRWPVFPHPVLQLPAPVEFFHKAARVPPTRFRFYVKLEKNFGSHHALDLQTGRCADLLKHLAALSNQNPLLPSPLAVDGRRDPGQPR